MKLDFFTLLSSLILLHSSQSFLHYITNTQIRIKIQPKLRNTISIRPHRPVSLSTMSTSLLKQSKDEINDIKSGDDTKKKEPINLLPSYIALFIILLTFSSNQWSRQALFYLCDFSATADPFKHINSGLSFDKEQYSTLASFWFTAIFATTSLFAGGIADKFSRKNIITLSCFIWSVATLAQSQATSFNQLIPLRIIVGLSQAFFNPAAFTLLSDIFPLELVGRINGILSGGVYIGGGLASLSILLDNSIGWRNTVSFIGNLCILYVYTL